jgi:CRP-like cAMP-binding protein
MDAPLDLLRKVSLFADLPEADLRELGSHCQTRTFTRGAPVTSAGSRGAGFFVIKEGKATVRVHGAIRRKLEKGDSFGELALIDGGRRTADITADTDLHCLGLSQKDFKAFVVAHPEVGWRLLQGVVGLLREAQDREVRAPSRRRGLGRRHNRV